MRVDKTARQVSDTSDIISIKTSLPVDNSQTETQTRHKRSTTRKIYHHHVVYDTCIQRRARTGIASFVILYILYHTGIVPGTRYAIEMPGDDDDKATVSASDGRPSRLSTPSFSVEEIQKRGRN